jgi:alpha-amylase/alpha-mannosidase (GH57 family)
MAQRSSKVETIAAFPVGEQAAVLEAPDSLQTVEQAAESGRRSPLGVYVVIHGHFYQPPRENPYLDAIVRQPSAAPCHDWNERVYRECYRPNAFARIFNDSGAIVGLVNNFEWMSFNAGPTLLSWLERFDPATYERILEGDRRSCDRLEGHGNAIAQVYNHIIMPLANRRDKQTQVRWGVADFRSRFGRIPEGIWLAETAVDRETLDVLIEEGIRFAIFAPSQALRCRPLPTPEHPDPDWQDTSAGQIDPTRPYRCFIPAAGDADAADDPDRDSELDPLARDRYIDLFFYDGPISGDMGFGDVLTSAASFADRLGSAVRDDRAAQVISVATDGETFGHHKRDKEKCLAYALTVEFPGRGWCTTNFAHYLSFNPPEWEVEMKSVTAWSCAHGVDRWQDDCGCGGGGGWHQQWRRPLRDSLNDLRDRLTHLYERHGAPLLRDPWLARDEYIELVLDRSPDRVAQFMARHQTHPLNTNEQIDALRLLEMQRYSLLMFTSCGWFFEELSRPEGVQILRYASRAIELAAEVAGANLEPEFVKNLSVAPSNVADFGDGAAVYRQLVVDDRVSFEQVAAAYAIGSLIPNQPRQGRAYCYTIEQPDYELQRLGSLALAVGELRITSDITGESAHLVFGALHLGGWDFHCCVQPFQGRLAYSKLKERLLTALDSASAAQVVLALSASMGGQSQGFALGDLCAEDRDRLMRLLVQDTTARLDTLYDRAYRDNCGILTRFYRDALPVPRELQVAAEIALGQRMVSLLQRLVADLTDASPLHLDSGPSALTELEALAAEAQRLQCQLDASDLAPLVAGAIAPLLERAIAAVEHADFDTLERAIEGLDRLVALGRSLRLALDLDLAQERLFFWWQGMMADTAPPDRLLNLLADLGRVLSVRLRPGTYSNLLIDRPRSS